MMIRLLEKWSTLRTNTSQHWRWFGYLLTIAAIVYLLLLLYLGRDTLKDVAWKIFLPDILFALLIYLASLLLMYYVWSRILSFHHNVSWQDAAIYFRTLLMRRLPGGIWHWVGRAAIYQSTGLSTKIVLLANFLEWANLILVATAIIFLKWDTLPMLLRILLAVLMLALSTALSFAWQPKIIKLPWRLFESFSWILCYGGSWLLGGWILFLLIQTLAGDMISFWSALWIWSITGGTSFVLLVISPAGLGIRELTLMWLLRPYLSATESIVIAILIRVIFTAADIIWGVLGWWVASLMNQQEHQNTD